MIELDDKTTMRYSRHILIPDIDMDGQEALMNARVLVVGLGGLGCACAPYLASSGIGQLTLVDFDQVDHSNLQRQILHTEKDVGRDKVESAAASLKAINSQCQIHTVNEKLDEQALFACIAAHDVVVDCTDNLQTRQLINQGCVTHAVPLVSGAAIRMEGQVCTFPMQGGPCYQCFSQRFGEQELSCVEAGIVAPMVGVVGTFQALEVVKLITGVGQVLDGRILMIDGKSLQNREFKFAANPQCAVCAN